MHVLAPLRECVGIWRLCLALVLSLSYSLSGCGNALTADDASSFARSEQSLSDTTCITLQRGTSGSVADAHISSHQPSHASGSEPVLHVGQVGVHSRQALLRFDTSTIPPHATLTSATLSLWRQGSSQPFSLTAHAITAPWLEESVSWQGFSSASAPQVAASLSSSGKPGPLSTSLMALASVWVRYPSLNRGLLLQQSQGHSLLASSESPEAARRQLKHLVSEEWAESDVAVSRRGQ